MHQGELGTARHRSKFLGRNSCSASACELRPIWSIPLRTLLSNLAACVYCYYDLSCTLMCVFFFCFFLPTFFSWLSLVQLMELWIPWRWAMSFTYVYLMTISNIAGSSRSVFVTWVTAFFDPPFPCGFIAGNFSTSVSFAGSLFFVCS